MAAGRDGGLHPPRMPRPGSRRTAAKSAATPAPLPACRPSRLPMPPPRLGCATRHGSPARPASPTRGPVRGQPAPPSARTGVAQAHPAAATAAAVVIGAMWAAVVSPVQQGAAGATRGDMLATMAPRAAAAAGRAQVGAASLLLPVLCTQRAHLAQRHKIVQSTCARARTV